VAAARKTIKKKVVRVEEYYEEEEEVLQEAHQSAQQAAHAVGNPQDSDEEAEVQLIQDRGTRTSGARRGIAAPKPSAAPPPRPRQIEDQNPMGQLAGPAFAPAGQMQIAPSLTASRQVPQLGRASSSVFASPFGNRSLIGEMMRRSMWGPPPPPPPTAEDQNPSENQLAIRSVFTRPFPF
jgi:hypothetical protein